ncbi:intracellular multiplication protein IcmK [Serratia fonticola]|uniref:Intracellular multiplication protein IcmK n=1 Tax=Serratia fonticola TaxID=47917 RepID=A0A542BFH0_SERFO|nr:DotH/IcmK family type IV secretion protein [Serratia fonticola]TQI77290.1 intracellular multiplication protein IcmK [Serratia fonticola]TQI93584.1 intracellular multiplication protein IcmK [Serratia fonticola]TVZ61613.1 intracellular multiplication protein IcmK [Serratia fonticola]
MKIRLLTIAILLLSAGSVLAADWADARTNVPTTALPPAQAPAVQAPADPISAIPPTQNEPATDITAPLRQSPPLPPSAAEAWAIGQAAPLNRGEIENVSRAFDDASRGRAWQPADVVPRISTLTVNLSPGASLPVLRTATHQASTVMFTDNTGAPWPLAAPPYNANSDGFTVNYIPDSSVMTVQARRQYDRGNITVYMKGLAVPIIVDVTSGEASNTATSRVIDTRLDLRIPQRGPQAKKMTAPQSKIGLNDPTLQAFLDGVPPKDARRLKTEGAVPNTQVWQMGDDLYIRTRSELRDAFEQTLASGDGTWLYKLPLTPEVAFSHTGKTVWMTLALE